MFSHIIWDIDVFEGELIEVEEEAIFDDSSLKFVNFEEISNHPFPVSHQKILAEVLNKSEN